jgi:hypothetical protein
MPVADVVKRAFDLAEQSWQELINRKMLITIPDLAEVNAPKETVKETA